MGVEVCPVHKSVIQSFQFSSIHVDAMLCDPQPKGQKRKYQEEDEGDPPPSAAVKYSQQRQNIFEMSYEKLCRFRQAPDSSLLRYVLIFNTMRRVEQDMERDGIKINCLANGPFLPPGNCDVSTLDPPPSPHAIGEGGSCPIGFPPSPYAASVTATEVDPKPSMLTSVIHIHSPSVSTHDTVTFSCVANGAAASAAPNYNSNCGTNADNDRCMMELDCPQSGRMTPFIRTPYERVDSGSALWTDESDRLTSLNWSSVLNFSSSCATSSSSQCTSTKSGALSNGHFDSSCSRRSGDSTSDDASCGTETSLYTLMPPTTGSTTCMGSLSIGYSSNSSASNSPSSGTVSPSSSSSPTSSEDEIFGDIDLTLYDFDFLSPLSPPNVRMAPVSAEELMRSLSNNADSPNHHPPRSTVGFYKSDHFSDDREQQHVVTSVRS